MNVSAYEKEADENKHFYFVNFKDMAKVRYKFVGPHVHHSIEMVFCYGGKLKANINKKEIEINKNDILFINPLDWHYYEYVDTASCFILVISKDYYEDLLLGTNKEFSNKITLNQETTDDVYNLLSSISDDYEQMSYIKKKSLIFSLFSKIESFNLLRDKEDAANKDICKKIISYIEEHYNEKLSIGRVAGKFV